MKAQTTGRETQRGPKTAREQAVSRQKPLPCQSKRLRAPSLSPRRSD